MYVAAARQDLTAEGQDSAMIPALFMLALIPPSYFFLGELRLSPMRVLLLVTFLPLLFRLLSGAAGKIRAMDVLIMLFMAWIVVTLVYNNGVSRFPYAMMTMVELFGGYLIGRVLIRSEADFRRLFRYALWVMIFLFPFVLVEFLTDRNILQEISRQFLPTLFKGESSRGRLGLYRVMAGFEHPILYGLFCSMTLTVLFLMARRALPRLILLAFVGFMTFASLSSAPLLAFAIQLGLLFWGRVMGNRWAVLIGLLVTVYVTVDLLSNRTPVTILINYITFDANTAWTRILIWDFGSAEMWRHPVFGIGLNDWIRPQWLTGSVDNFWLLIGMHHGVLGLALLMAAIVSGLWALLTAKGLSDDEKQLRSGYVITFAALCFTLATVHIWGGTSSLVMLLLGAAHWFRDSHRPQALREGAISAPGLSTQSLGRGAGLSYSRFSAEHKRTPQQTATIGGGTIAK